MDSIKKIEKHIRACYADKVLKIEGKEHLLLSDAIQIALEILTEKKKEKIEYWSLLVNVYFVFYKEKYNAEPDFTRQNPKHLKEIVQKVRKFAEEQQIEWSEENAAKLLKEFLEDAYADWWLRENFLLSNINAQYQKIREASAVRKALFIPVLEQCHDRFYKSKFGSPPDLNPKQKKALIEIAEKLKETALGNKLLWSAAVADRYLSILLDSAHEDKWLRENFLLTNINKQFQKIRDNARGRNQTNKRVSDNQINQFISGGKADSRT